MSLIITSIGAAKLASAATGGPVLRLAQMAVGDADGSLLSPASVALGNERYRDEITQAGTGDGTITVTGVVPAVIGGFTLREIGVFDLDGDLIACGPIPAQYKPLPTESHTFEQRLNVVLAINPATALIALKELDLNAANAQFARADLANVDRDALLEKIGVLPEIIISTAGGAYGMPDGAILRTSGAFE